MSWFDKNKHEKFPEVKDFGDPQDQWRKADTRELSYHFWFWYHPSAFSLINFGIPVIGLIEMIALIVLNTIFWQSTIVLAIILLFMFFFILYLRRTIMQKRVCKDLTFYDVFLREYKITEVKPL